jgi:UDP-N-acetylglucosamine 2-epimerase (non-hydrolysing)
MKSTIEKKIWILVGTRPEVIKQIPLYFACVRKFGRAQVALIGTGQHRELLEQALAHFEATLDFNMNIMKPDQSLAGSSAAVMSSLDDLFKVAVPEWLIVQGDTTSAAMAAWAAFQRGIKVGHNEAGLRSYDLQNPFPEEANRRLISVVASRHFAPTDKARMALIREGVAPDSIITVGNTGIDALRMTLQMPRPRLVCEILAKTEAWGMKPVLLTAHRRENRGQGMESWFQALADFLDRRPDLALIYPNHPNKAGLAAAEKYLARHKQVFILPALNYAESCHLMSNCRFVVTDSGGIQEEACALGLPVVVCRKTTERMEAVEADCSRLAGTDTSRILSAMEWAYERKAASNGRITNQIFGDGFAAERITEALWAEAGLRNRLQQEGKASVVEVNSGQMA